MDTNPGVVFSTVVDVEICRNAAHEESNAAFSRGAKKNAHPLRVVGRKKYPSEYTEKYPGALFPNFEIYNPLLLLMQIAQNEPFEREPAIGLEPMTC